MPTGYTHAIEKGIDFRTFALQCARAFGALIEMRDDPMDAPIPREFKPSTHNAEALNKAAAELLRLQSLSVEQCNDEAMLDWITVARSRDEAIAKAEELRKKYVAMLATVNQWEPPTGDHSGLKRFMQEQIESSINGDCSTSYWREMAMPPTDPEAWRDGKVAKIVRDMEYHSKADREERERTAERNEWIKALLASLPGVRA